MTELDLPWPPRSLYPNSRPHWSAKAKAAKAYRAHAFYAAKAAGMKKSKAEAAHVDITFHPPSHRRMDLDGMLSSIKNGLDGISDALGVDDAAWAISIRKGQPEKGGRVTVTIITTGQTNEGLQHILECIPTES